MPQKYQVTRLSSDPDIWHGTDSDGCCNIIYRLSSSGNPYSFGDITIRTGVKLCLIEDGIERDLTASVIKHATSNVRRKEFFKTVSWNALHDHRPNSSQEVVDVFLNLRKIFSNSDLSKSDILGVWGELVTIDTSSDIKLLSAAWSKPISSTWDFCGLSHQHIECKCSSQDNIKPKLSLKQCLVPTTEQCALAWCHGEFSPGGITLEELANRIRERLADDAEVLNHFNLVYQMKTKGSPLVYTATLDYETAAESLQIFDMKLVPRPTSVPDTVSEVTFRTDLNALQRWSRRPNFGIINTLA